MNAPQRSLTDMIGSRICHDLISPIGAISNGVELMTMGNSGVGPELDLISESVDNANAKIRYFRIAFGAASPGQRIGRSEIVGILAEKQRDNRLLIDWQPDSDLDRTQVKLTFLLIMCFETAMPWGGRVTINAIGDQWAISGQADQLKIDPELWAGLTQNGASETAKPATVHFPMAAMVANDIGRELRFESSATKIRVRF